MIILRQKQYARLDYKDLSFLGRMKLGSGRGKLASKLRADRKFNNMMSFGDKVARNNSHETIMKLNKAEKEKLLEKIRRSDLKYNLKN